MIGERLAELRKDNGLRQTDLAAALNVTSAAISGYETGRNTPSDEMKVAIAKFFNISLDYLLGAIDEEIALDRSNTITLPKGFPLSELDKVFCLIDLIMKAQ